MDKQTQKPWHKLSDEEKLDIAQEQDTFEQCLDYLRQHAAGEVEGFYGPDSMTWRIYREPAILLGGLRAILLQIAHPRVAAGVDQNSNFRRDMLGRARRTFTSMYELIFGDLNEGIAAARRVHNVHALVRGRVDASRPAHGANKYRAHDPDLARWVLSTLIDTAIEVYTLFVGPLTLDEKRRYYLESHLAAAQFGIQPGFMPATYEDFQTWFNDRLASAELQVGPAAVGLAHTLFNSPYTRGPLDDILTAGLLPDHFRKAFNLEWGAKEQRTFRLLTGVLRRSMALTPDHLRYVTAWHQAQLRMATARGQRRSLYGRFLNELDRHWDVPMSIKPSAVKGNHVLGEKHRAKHGAADATAVGPAGEPSTGALPGQELSPEAAYTAALEAAQESAHEAAPEPMHEAAHASPLGTVR